MRENKITGEFAGPVVQVGSVNGDLHLRPQPAGSISQLPAAVPHFVGRRREMALLNSRLAAVGARTLVITAINGTAGIGKTSLALHWAHSVKDRFPDGQLYVDLLGFGRGQPLDPATAIQDFLTAFQVPRESIPPTMAGRTALYRSLLADRRMLVVLDNARDAEQARPLLPGSPACLVLVTSRNCLTSLVAREGATHVELDFPSLGEARDMLSPYLGRRRIAEEDDDLTALIERCARLPVALTIAGARVVTEPYRPLNRMVTELAELAELSTGDSETTDISAVFHASYRVLAAGAARLFRLLGLHPGGDIGTAAAASLAGLPLPAARRLLDVLTRAYLAAEGPADRFHLHDLLRDYAVDRGRHVESARDRHAAVARMLDHYSHTAHANDRALYPHRDPIALGTPGTGVTTTPATDRDEAWHWFTAERHNLLQMVELAAREGLDRQVWTLSWALSTYFGRIGNWHDWESTQHAAVRAARRLGDTEAEAASLRILGRIMTLTARYDEAVSYLVRALHTATDVNGRAHVHHALSLARERTGRLAEAHSHAVQAASLAESTGHRLRLARALSQLGRVQSEIGAHAEAHASCLRSVHLLEEAGDRVSLGDALEGLGRAAHGLADHKTAATFYRRAIALFEEYGDLHSQAHVMARLGDALAAEGNLQEARTSWTRAAAMLTQSRHPAATALLAKSDS